MKTFLVILLILIILSACAGKKVKTEDLNSWQGQNVSLLEKHPFYSALSKQERMSAAPDTRILVYVQKKIVETGNQGCLGTGVGLGNIGLGTMFCSPREMEEKNCFHQFTVVKNLITEYTVTGEGCYTECEMRPLQKCD